MYSPAIFTSPPIPFQKYPHSAKIPHQNTLRIELREVILDLKHLFASGNPLIFHTPSRGEGWKKNPQRAYLPLSPLIPVK